MATPLRASICSAGGGTGPWGTAMQKRLIVAAGAGLLMGVSLAGAAPQANLSDAASAATASAIQVASRRDRTWSSSPSSSRASSPARSSPAPRWSPPRSPASSSAWSTPAARAWGSEGRRWNAPAVTRRAPSSGPSFGPRVVAPYTARPRYDFYGNGSRGGRPYGRHGRRHVSSRLLAPLIIAGSTYHAYRYLPYDGPACSGITENGCELRWVEVPLKDSDAAVPQCVEFCPQY